MAEPSEPSSSDPSAGQAAHHEPPSAAAQLFDLRTVIAILFGAYGIVLTIMGLIFEAPGEIQKAGGIDINLWSGIVMIVIAVLFVVWARLRPLIPPGGDA